MPKYIHVDLGMYTTKRGHSWHLAERCVKTAEDLGFDSVVLCKSTVEKETMAENSSGSFGNQKFKFVDYIGNTHRFSLCDAGQVRWPIIPFRTLPGMPRAWREVPGLLKGRVAGVRLQQVQCALGKLTEQLAAYYSSLQLERGDVVLFATSNEFEMAAHTQAIARLGTGVDWRVVFYFHWGIFSTASSSRVCSPKSRIMMMRDSIQASWKYMKARQKNSHLFAVSSGLARQLTPIIEEEVIELPVPATDSGLAVLPTPLDPVKNGLVRVGIAAFRNEQGVESLPRILNNVISAESRSTTVFVIPCQKNTELQIRSLVEADKLQSCEFWRYPLGADYSTWMNSCEAILLPYCSERYNVSSGRASGVALEAAVSGKVLIVPKKTSLATELCNEDLLDEVVASGQLSLMPRGNWVGYSYQSMEELKSKILAVTQNVTKIQAIASHQTESIRHQTNPSHFIAKVTGCENPTN